MTEQPDPLEPLREAVERTTPVPFTEDQRQARKRTVRAIEREAARLVLRELEQMQNAKPEPGHENGLGVAVARGRAMAERITYWRERAT